MALSHRHRENFNVYALSLLLYLSQFLNEVRYILLLYVLSTLSQKKTMIPIIYELSSLADRIAFYGLQVYVRFNFNMAERTKFDIVVTCDRYMGVAHLQLQNTNAILFFYYSYLFHHFDFRYMLSC